MHKSKYFIGGTPLRGVSLYGSGDKVLANSDFWCNRPWAGGGVKHRLGLHPQAFDTWLQQTASDVTWQRKQQLLAEHYADVVCVHSGYEVAQEQLRSLPISNGL